MAMTVLFSSKTGDIDFPMAPSGIDTIEIDNLIVPGNTSIPSGGSITGTGFNASVQAATTANAPAVRYLPLTDVHADNGLPLLTTTAASTLPGIARTAGTSIALTGVATADTTPATTKMIWEFDLPSTYVADAAIPVKVNCVVPTATDVTAASTTMTVNMYTVSAAGVEAALTVSAAQQIPLTTAGTLTYSVTGTGLVPGSHVILELVALVTTITGGASSVQVNSVGFQA